MTDNMPDEIFVSGRNAYRENDVFSHNYDGTLLARDAWECTKYTRADKTIPPEVIAQVAAALERYTGVVASVNRPDSFLSEIEDKGFHARKALALLQPYVKETV